MLLFDQEEKRILLEALEQTHEVWENGESDEDNLKDRNTLKNVYDKIESSPVKGYINAI